jgi:hypothetical protein
MSGWITWDELKERWNLVDHEIIDRLKQDLQPYSKNTGNIYDCPPEFHIVYHTKMRISELTDQIEKQATELLNSGTNPYIIYSDSGVSDLQDERSFVKKGLDKIINEDPTCRSWKNFEFGKDKEKARELISELKEHVSFKLKDIEAFEKEHGYVRKNADSSITPKSEQLEDFIKRLEFFYENDSEIKIKEPGKRAKLIGYGSLGFRDNQTKSWKCLQEILDDPDLKYALGPAGEKNSPERKSYDARRKQLDEINQKLIEFFKKEYGVRIPKGYKLYKKCSEAGSGVFKFKFSIHATKLPSKRLEGQYEAYTELELEYEIKKLSKKYGKTQDEKCMSEFVAATKVALRKGFLSDAQVREMLEPIRPREEHIYNPNENVKDFKRG